MSTYVYLTITHRCIKVVKIDCGGPQFSLTWLEGGSGVVVQTRQEALVISLLMEDAANLGLLDNYVGVLQRILKPFCTPNFVNHQLS